MFDLLSDVSGLVQELRDLRAVLVRGVEALERLSPPLPAFNPGQTSEPDSGNPAVTFENITFAESPEQYQSRMDTDAELAVQLGIAPWSPDFQSAVADFRNGLMRTKVALNEETGENEETPGLSKEEADRVIKEAFRSARAEENHRPE